MGRWVDLFYNTVLRGNPTAPTPASGDNDTSISTTAFVQTAIANTTVATVAALRLITPLYAGQKFDLLGHTTTGIGGGTFYYDATDTTSTDDNGTIIVNGAYRFKRIYEGTKFSDWFGCDVAANTTSSLQAFLNLGGDLTISPRATPYMIDPTVNPTTDNFGGLKLVSNTDLKIPFGCTLQAFGVTQTFTCTLQGYNVDNISITGFGTIKGEKSTHIGSTGEHGMGLLIRACTNYFVDEVTVTDCWGDCMYIGYAVISAVHKNSQTGRVGKVNLYNARRQGISVTGANALQIDGAIISNITGAPPAAAIDLEPDSASFPNSDIDISNVTAFDCDQGLTMYLGNIKVTGDGNNFKSRGAALSINDGSIEINVGGIFEGGLNGTSPSVSLDGTGFVDMSEVHLTSSMTIIGNGTQGALYTSAQTNYADINGVNIVVKVAQVAAISNSGNNKFYNNRILMRDSALSGVSKTVIFSQKGEFGNNYYTNTTAQTPTYLYIGTTRITQPEIKLGEDSNTLNDWKSAKPWTPTLGTTGTQPTSVTNNANTGATYTKIGDIVFVQGQLRTSALTVGPATGSVVINGLPFPAVASTGSTVDGYGDFVIGQSAGWTKAPLTGLVFSGESRIRLQTRVTFAGDSTDTVVADLTAGAGNIVFFSGWYKTTAT